MYAESTLAECVSPDASPAIMAIRRMLGVHRQLAPHAEQLDVQLHGPMVVVRGRLPAELADLVLPAIRQAGVLHELRLQIETTDD
ncbi:MAG: hypothetical protein AAGA03_02620 [Planctomycetota bacterium]